MQRVRSGTITRRPTICLALAASALLLSAAPAFAGTIFTVTSTADTSGTSCGVTCTLRQAITASNLAVPVPGDSNTINFNILPGGGQKITPGSALPPITEPVNIDGHTQGGWAGTPLIELDGTSAGPTTAGLTVSASSTTITDLAINRFKGDGVVLTSPGGDTLARNYIGTSVAGNGAGPGNGGNGVTISAGSNGDLITLDLISANAVAGIAISAANSTSIVASTIGGNAAGTAALANASGITVSGASSSTAIGGPTTSARNMIIGNTGPGISLGSGATLTSIQGNLIGTNTAGSAGAGGLGNGSGIIVSGADHTTVGGTVAASSNTIAGNAGDGVQLANGAHDNTVGTATAVARNVISGNLGASSYGVEITGAATATNSVAGNVIGLNSANNVLGNTAAGISINSGAHDNLVGGSIAARNTISGNTGWGVIIDAAGATAHPNTVNSNFIGLSTNGVTAIGNGQSGVLVRAAAASNVISGNVISWNTFYGVRLTGTGTTANSVTGNTIGLDVTGQAPRGNGTDGIHIDSGASANQIGDLGAGNLIAFNGAAGVAIPDSSSTGNAIRANGLFSNAGLGIDLGVTGVQPNSPGGPHSGPNNLQNYPIVTSAANGDSGTVVSGTLNSNPNDTFAIDLFSSPSCDGSGYGEGKSYLTTVTVNTDGSGNASFTAPLGSPVAAGDQITATATESTLGNTSEFSPCQAVSAPTGKTVVTTTTTSTTTTTTTNSNSNSNANKTTTTTAAAKQRKAAGRLHVPAVQHGTVVHGALDIAFANSTLLAQVFQTRGSRGQIRTRRAGRTKRRHLRATRLAFAVGLDRSARATLRKRHSLRLALDVVVTPPGKNAPVRLHTSVTLKTR